MNGQACDGAHDVLGKDSGVSKRLNDENEKALPIYCLGHCASLFVKSIENFCRGMTDCMDVCLEIVKLITFSPKR